jgi:hypothetical protein
LAPPVPAIQSPTSASSTMFRFFEPYLHFASVQKPPNGFGANP